MENKSKRTYTRRKRYPTITPSKDYSSDSFLDDLIFIVDYLSDLDKTGNRKYVLSRRFGLYGLKKMTLIDIGKTRGFTKERARQLESEAISSIRRLVEGKISLSPRCFLAPELRSKLQIFFSLSDSWDLEHREHVIKSAEVTFNLKILGTKKEAWFDLLMRVANMSIIRLNDTQVYASKKHSSKTIRPKLDKIKNIIFKDEDGIDIDQLSKRMKMSKHAIRTLATTLDDIEFDPNSPNFFKPSFHKLTFGKQARVILKERNEGLHYKEIEEEIKKRTGRDIDKINFSSTKGLKAKGKSGVWGLEEWDNDHTSYKDVIIKVIKSFDRPVSREELLSLAKEIRPDFKNEHIRSYIHHYPDTFVLLDNDYITIKEWFNPKTQKEKIRHKKAYLSQKEVDKHLIPLLKSSPKTTNYIVDVLASIYSYNRKKLVSKVHNSKILRRVSLTYRGKRYKITKWTLRRNYQDLHNKTKVPKEGHILSIAKDMIKASEGGYILYTDFVKHILDKYGYSRPTIYGSIRKSSTIKRVLKDKKSKILTLRG